ncbi:hypothetical protein B9Z19DRAFT_277757 [Tuber borchii]|uniref:Uncharacterized protein n=1 Tax=Tuber borchii TaxID=42251 RepID=A0A2T7A951_TUBBO|nr:hypothetical protein B9Z19DRAFT_277757 [Tuber borchii]
MPARHAASAIMIACAPDISSLNGPLLSSPDGYKTVPPLAPPLPPFLFISHDPQSLLSFFTTIIHSVFPPPLFFLPLPVVPPPLSASLPLPSFCFSFTTNWVEGIIDWLAVWARLRPYRTPCPSSLLIPTSPLQPCFRGSRLLSLADLTDTSISLNHLCSASTGTSG